MSSVDITNSIATLKGANMPMIIRYLMASLLILFAWPASAQDSGQYQTSPTQAVDGQFAPLRITQLRELIVSIAGGGSATTPGSTYNKNFGVTTYTKTDVTLTGSSQTMLPASNTRNAVTVYNPVTNASVYVELSGGAAVSDNATQIPAGSTLVIAGSVVPKTAITIIGTNGQHVYVQEGN